MAGEANQTQGSSSLASFVVTQHKFWARQREKIELKWNRNRNYFMQEAGDEWKIGEGEKWRSKAFPSHTRDNIIAALALVLDAVLQGGRIPFELQPDPDTRSTQQDLDNKQKEIIDDAIDEMDKLIEGQLADSHADRAFGLNVLSGAVYGETLAKTPLLTTIKKGWQEDTIEGVEDTSTIPDSMKTFSRWVRSSVALGWQYVSVWNVFRDLEEDDPRKGAGFIHRVFMSPWELRQKFDEPFFIPGAINKVIQESEAGIGTSGSNQTLKDPEGGQRSISPGQRDIQHRKKKIIYREFWGRAPIKRVEDFETRLRKLVESGADVNNFEDLGIEGTAVDPLTAPEDEDGRDVEIMCVVADRHVIRFSRSDQDLRPIYRGIWEENLDEPHGRSVADNTEDEQRTLIGAYRCFEDTSKLSSVFMIAIKEALLENPEDINKGIQSGFLKLLVSDDVDDARRAVQQLGMENSGQNVLKLVELVEKRHEEAGKIPRINRGFQPEQATTTAFAIAQQLEKSSKYIGSVIRNYDEGLIEPIITSMYDYNMEDPTVTRGKGNYTVKAAGYSSFQNRIQRVQRLEILLRLILSDEDVKARYKINEFIKEIGHAIDVDTKSFEKSNEELEAEQQLFAQQQAEAAEIAKRSEESNTEKNLASAADSRSKAVTRAAEAELKAQEQEKLDNNQTLLDGDLEGGAGV